MRAILLRFFILSLINLSKSQIEDLDSNLHESQIPPPYSQPSPEEVKDELSKLFNQADKDKNSLLSIDEIAKWNDRVHKEIIKENIDRQWYYYEPTLQLVHSWEGYRPEEKEVLIWENYTNKTDIDEINQYSDNIEKLFERARKRWDIADKNNDSVLIKDEFKDFMHPEESDRDEVKNILIKEAFDDMDKDNDNLVSLEEYMNHLSNMSQQEGKEDPNWAQAQQDHFSTYLDIDKNGVLNSNEIKNWLIPSSSRHELEAKRLLSESDKNHDGQLNEQEILDNYNEFFTLIPPAFWSKYMPDDRLYQPSEHDEL